MGGCVGFERTDYLTVSTLEGYVVVLERTDLYISTLGGCGGLERTHWEGMVVLKEEFLLWEEVVVLKKTIIYSLYLGGICIVLERLICMFLLWEDVVVLKEHIGRVWWSERRVSTLGEGRGLEKTDYLTVSTLEGYVLFLKELIFNSFCFGG